MRASEFWRIPLRDCRCAGVVNDRTFMVAAHSQVSLLTKTEIEPPEDSPVSGALISVGFWCCLLVATVAYAAATLSSSYEKNEQLHTHFVAAEAELQQLAGQVGRYERYCEQLSRSEDATMTSGGTARSMRVDASLQFHLDDTASSDAAAIPTSGLSLVTSHLSRSTGTRRTLIGLSAVLLMIAFGMFVEPRNRLAVTNGSAPVGRG